MFITQLEYREKRTATNWKRIKFPLQVNLTAEDAQLPQRLLTIIGSLPAFGSNAPQHSFTDAICRVTFQAAHSEYMWFAKSTVQDGQLLVDEEELYDQDNTMLMRRAFGELTVGDQPVEAIPVEQSMLAQHPESEALQALQRAFQRVQHYQLTDANLADNWQQIQAAPHGTLLLLDGSALSAPLDLSPLTSRQDVQVIATGCTGLPAELSITQKGKMISCNVQ